jgi:uncharacterized protein YjdB
MKMRKIGQSIIFCLIISTILVFFLEMRVIASQVTLPNQYYFVFNGQQKPAGTEYELKTPELLLSITSGAWEPTTTVEWISSETGVVAIESTTYGTNFVKLIRKGPGYSTITAVIKNGTNTYSLSCVIKVDLSFDYQKTGLKTATTTNERFLELNTIPQKKQIFLKFIDYTPENEDPVDGAPILGSSVEWESDNEGVVTVDGNGFVTAVGSGSAMITVTTNTMSTKDKTLSISLRVIVKPEFKLTYNDAGGNAHSESSVEDVDLVNPVQGVPSNFIIKSNATLAQNLKWKVYEVVGNKRTEIAPGTTAKMTYAISQVSGNVSFSNVKAGTYEIFTFVDSRYNIETNAPYAYMKFVVPIRMDDTFIVMGVKDTYSIPGNSNIPFVNVFDYTVIGDQNIINLENGIITAKKEGSVTVRLSYISGTNIYDGTTQIDAIDLTVKVIDGISLSATKANLYTSGTFQLNALITDYTVPVVWSSNNTKVATVDSGLVKAVGVGTAIITAKQTIKGVVKSATCQITVQQSVASITITPDKVNFGIGDFQTLHATVTPNNLSGVSLQWKSSNNSVVKVLESSALTATIQGVAGGSAVISAINQDNVVVGFCHVTVKQPVTSVVLSETDLNLDLKTKKIQLRATVYPDNASNKEVKWSTTDSSKAKVDQNGNVTLLKAGTVSIIATAVDNTAATAICNINILVPVQSIALDETVKTMYVGQAERLSYVVLPTNANNNVVIWTSTNPSAATVDTTGRVTAKGVGTTVIMLQTVDGGYSAYCTITVKRIATGVKFDVSDLKLKTGQFYNIKTTLTPKDSTDTDLVWESSDTKVAVVDDTGKVTAKGSGVAVIMARTEAGGIAYCKVTVTQAVTGIILNYSEKVIFVGDELKLKVSVSPSEATERRVTFKSSNTKVATISEEGVIEGLIGGTTVITVTTVDGGYSATCVVTVREPITNVTLNYEDYRLGVGKTFTLTATVTTETATNPKVTWTSSNKKVAVVNSKGKVTGIAKGYATITATAQDGSEVEASCEVRVVTPVTKITLNKTYVNLLIGQTESLKATVLPTNSTYRNVKWTSSDNNVAAVDEDGTVTALKPGSATIVAEATDSSGKSAICYVTIRDRVAATGITVMDKKIVMVAGEEKVVQVALNPVTSTDGFSWSTDNAAVANVDKKSGKITARSTGTANITVMTTSGKTALIEVTVIGLNVSSLTLEQYSEYALSIEGTSSRVAWMTSNPTIAIVKPNGTVSTRGTGTVTITATVNGVKLNCKLKVIKIQ